MTASEMTNSPARPGFTAVTPYLVLPRGTARDFLRFVEAAFDGEQNLTVPRPDGSIMHAEVRLGTAILECADANDVWTAGPVALHLYVPDVDATTQAAVAAGATLQYPVVEQDYGDREAGILDPFGNEWYVATHRGPHHVPEAVPNLMPYLHPSGAAALIDFYVAAFGAEKLYVGARPDGTVFHAKIRFGADGLVELGEAHGPWQPKPAGLHHYVSDVDAAFRRAVAAGATVRSAPADQHHGERMAHILDPAGNSWFLAQVLGR